VKGDPNDERLSRYLDDDLGQGEREAVERLLASDPVRLREFEAMGRLRDSVAVLADWMELPCELDALLEPLRRDGTSRPRRSLLAARWAAAAAAVLGAALLIWVVRHDTAPRSTAGAARRQPPQQDVRDRGVFQLQPLPTSARPADELPLGATERLLATPLPQPTLDDPTPLVIVGPLSEPPSSTRPSAMVATLTVTDPTGSVSVPLSLQAPLPVGRYSLVVVVSNGVISEVGVSGQRASGERVSEALEQLWVAAIADGRHRADLTVGPPS
jgi:anti-sigma factor RsiW